MTSEPTDELTAISYEVTDRVATIRLDRPHRHNAWTGTNILFFDSG